MLYPSGRYNLNFDISAILLCSFILIFFLAKKDLRIPRIRTFLCVVLFMLLASAGGLVMDIIRNGDAFCPVWRAELATFFAHFCHNSIPYLLMLYFLSITGIWHGMKRANFVLISIPEAVLLAVHLIPGLRHRIYYYDADCRYIRGPLYGIYGAVIGIYVAGSILILIRHFRAIRRRDRIYILTLGGGFLFSMAVGYVNPYLRITNFLQTLFMMGSFFALENDDALIDLETGIYNIQAISRDAQPLFQAEYPSWVLGIKFQHFNYYRLMLGASATANVLRQIGCWMKEMENGRVTFYRPSQGEFAAILFNAAQEEAVCIAEKLRERFARPWQYAETDASITIPAQIWISSIPDRISSEEQLFVFVTSAFNDVLPKDRVFVADEMQEEKRRIDVDVAIRRALSEDSFEVYYQPIYDTREGKIRSCEALVRMNDRELGYVSPEEFIKIAEQTGTVSQIGAAVFEKVCRFLAKQKPSQYGLSYVEVNLSTIQCMDEDLVEEYRSIMQRYGVSPEEIVLEITESALIHNEDRMQKIVQRLRDAGFAFALDDFGTGRANYGYVMNFPFRIIKVDKSFLWEADKSAANTIILKSMLQLIRDLHLETVVEGVETKKQRDMLVEAGVTYLQGYYYSKPVPEDAFLEYLRNFNKIQQGISRI